MDTAALVGHLVPAGSVYGFLAEYRGEVIPSVLVMQTLQDLSDAEAMQALRCDLRWKVACGLPIDHEGFHPTTLTVWRNRLRASQRPQRSFAARNRLRHTVNVVGWNPSWSIGSPHATFQRRSHRTACIAPASDRSCNVCITSTDAITSPATDGRPRPDGNRSANNPSGNTSPRYSARNAYTLPAGTRCPTNAAVSISSRSGPDLPCTHQLSIKPDQPRRTARRIIQGSPSVLSR